MAKEKTVKPFGIADKVGYLMGDFGNDFTFMLTTMFLMKFYSDVMGVSVTLIGTMMMVARLVDAFTDVAMGQIVDRSKPTAEGKFTPWLRRMSGPVALASLLMYASWFKDMPMGFKIVWMFVTYILWGSICYTGVNIPYGSMASAITADPKERASLSTWRTMGGMMANMLIGVVMPLIVYYEDANGNQVLSGTRMTIGALICSIGALICYTLCCKLTTERVKMETTTEKFSLGKLVKSLVTNRALIGIVLTSICGLLGQLTSQGMNSYLYPNYFNNVKALSVAGFVSIPVMLILAAVAVPISMKIGRKLFTALGFVFGAVIMLIAYFMHTTNAWLFVGMYGLSWFGLGVFNMVCWAMITDVIDDTEVRTGERSDGTIYALYSFARKLGQAATSGLTGALLGMIGYTAKTAFDPSVTQGIYSISCLVPALGYVLAAVAVFFIYPLGKKRVEENARTLAEKREKAAK